jgi:hypothetical protein
MSRLCFAYFHFPDPAYADNITKQSNRASPPLHYLLLIRNNTSLTTKARPSVLRRLEDLLHSFDVCNGFVEYC